MHQAMSKCLMLVLTIYLLSSQTAKARQEAEYAQYTGGLVEMEMSDGDDSEDSSSKSSNNNLKRRKVKQEKVDLTSVKPQTPQTLLSMANGTVLI